MDWDYAIKRHRGPLLGHVMGLFVLIGLTEGGMVERLSKPIYRQALRVLRTAEAAVRRLIIVAARDIVVEPRKPRPPRSERKKPGETKSKSEGQEKGKAKRKRGFFFRLFDPPKRERRTYRRPPRRPQPDPRAYYLDVAPGPQSQIFLLVPQPQLPPAPPVVKKKVDDGTVNARHLCRRLYAIADRGSPSAAGIGLALRPAARIPPAANA